MAIANANVVTRKQHSGEMELGFGQVVGAKDTLIIPTVSICARCRHTTAAYAKHHHVNHRLLLLLLLLPDI